jgi:hypothetical protein
MQLLLKKYVISPVKYAISPVKYAISPVKYAIFPVIQASTLFKYATAVFAVVPQPHFQNRNYTA